jgi:hypothetical protein
MDWRNIGQILMNRLRDMLTHIVTWLLNNLSEHLYLSSDATLCVQVISDRIFR